MPEKEHHAITIEHVVCAVITTSDTRTIETDVSGALIRDLLVAAGHKVASHEVLPDDPARVRDRVVSLCLDDSTRAVLLTGGTGLAPRDSTYEAVISLFEKRLDGFGELFRMLSYEEIGAAAMLSRATAGTHGSTIVFSMPGSSRAVRLAMEKLVVPQLGHIAALL